MSEFDPEDIFDDIGGGGADESPSVRRFYWRAIQWLLVALGIQTIAGLAPGAIESYYSQLVYPYIPWLLAKVNRLSGYSFSEGFFVLLFSVFIIWGLWSVLQHYQGKAPFTSSLKIIFVYVIWTASGLFIAFKLMWGLNYQRLPLAEVGELAQRYPRSDELEIIHQRIVIGIRDNYRDLPGKNPYNAGALPADLPSISAALDLSFRRHALFKKFAVPEVASPKVPLSSSLMRGLGVRSFYLPFTGEVSVAANLNPIDLPFAMAKAKAYQRGYAREDEANFVAYLVCTTASDPLIRYSGFLHGIRVLRVLESSGFRKVAESVERGPLEDLERREASPDWLLGRYTQQAVDGIFNLHLRINRVVQGSKSADGDVDLIVAYYLKYPPTAPASPFPGNETE